MFKPPFHDLRSEKTILVTVLKHWVLCVQMLVPIVPSVLKCCTKHNYKAKNIHLNYTDKYWYPVQHLGILYSFWSTLMSV